MLACSAAETWLIPERFEVTPGATLQLDLIEVDPRPADDPAGVLMGADRVDYAFFRLGQENSTIRRFEPKTGGMNFSVQLQRPGVVAVVIGLKPIVDEMGPETLREKLQTLHLGERSKEELMAKIGWRRWKTSLSMHAKVFVRVGLPVETDREWERPTGCDFELVPESNPTTLSVGKPLPVRVLYKGTAVANMAVNFRTFDGSHQHVAYTDADGRAEAPLGAAGKWLIFGTILQPPGGTTGMDLTMEMTTLAVEVR